MKVVRFEYKPGKNFDMFLQELATVLRGFFAPYYEQVHFSFDQKKVRENLVKVKIMYAYIVKDRVMMGGYYQLVNREVNGMMMEFNYVIGDQTFTIFYQEESVFTPLLLITLNKIASRVQLIDGWYEIDSDVVRQSSEEVMLSGDIITDILYDKLLEISLEALEMFISIPVFINDTTFIGVYTWKPNNPAQNPLKMFDVKEEFHIKMNRVVIMVDMFKILDEVRKRKKTSYLVFRQSGFQGEESKVGLFIDLSDLSAVHES